MIYRHIQSEPVKENPHQVDVRQMYNMPSAQVMHITLQAGESLKPHRTPVDVAFFILEGEPTIHIGDESQGHIPGTLIESPADVVHYISNEKTGIARILVIKAPRPEKATKVL